MGPVNHRGLHWLTVFKFPDLWMSSVEIFAQIVLFSTKFHGIYIYICYFLLVCTTDIHKKTIRNLQELTFMYTIKLSKENISTYWSAIILNKNKKSIDNIFCKNIYIYMHFVDNNKNLKLTSQKFNNTHFPPNNSKQKKHKRTSP